MREKNASAHQPRNFHFIHRAPFFQVCQPKAANSKIFPTSSSAHGRGGGAGALIDPTFLPFPTTIDPSTTTISTSTTESLAGGTASSRWRRCRSCFCLAKKLRVVLLFASRFDSKPWIACLIAESGRFGVEIYAMTTRNRTPLYKKYRDALRSVRVPMASFSPSHAGPSSSASSSSSAGRGGPVIEMVSTSLLHPNRSYAPVSTEDPGNSSRGHLMVSLPPAWVDLSEEISANMQRARTKISELVKVHEKALMPSFGDGKEDQHTIEVLTHEITDLLKQSEKRLMKLSPSGPSEESNVRRNVQRSLATDLQNLSMQLRKKQSIYLKRLKEQKEGQDGLDFDMNINGTMSNMEDDVFVDVGFSEHQMSQLKRNEAFTREREREIAQVVESVNELAQIMKDLSVLVIDQGTIIDRIEYNIQNVASTVEEGYKQLQKAERTQRKGGMVMCATILVIMCFVMLVLLVLKEIFF